jgi:hypothetical protein
VYQKKPRPAIPLGGAAEKRILWLRRKLLITAVVCILVTAAFLSGLYVGQENGFRRGVDSIMDMPTDKNRPFTVDELN